MQILIRSTIVCVVPFACLWFVLAAAPDDAAPDRVGRADDYSGLERHLLMRAIEAQAAAVITGLQAANPDEHALIAYRKSLHEIFFIYWISSVSKVGNRNVDLQTEKYIRLYARECLMNDLETRDPLNIGDLLEKDSIEGALFRESLVARFGNDIIPAAWPVDKLNYLESAMQYVAWLKQLVE